MRGIILFSQPEFENAVFGPGMFNLRVFLGLHKEALYRICATDRDKLQGVIPEFEVNDFLMDSIHEFMKLSPTKNGSDGDFVWDLRLAKRKQLRSRL